MTCEPLDIKVPPGADLSNYLYPDLGLKDLTQDMVTVRLPNGFYVDAGWYPEHDPNGRFVIRVFHEFWDNQKINPVSVRTVEEVAYFVQELAQRYSQQIIPSSFSGSQRGEHIFA